MRPNGQAQAQPPERGAACNDDVRVSSAGQLPGTAAVAWSVFAAPSVRRADYLALGMTSNPNGIYLHTTTPVGSYAANGWGLYDMIGNVFEWCQDWYGAYPAGSVTDPQGAVSGSSRVLRGGFWNYDAKFCRSASRYYFIPGTRCYFVGFRLLLAPLRRQLSRHRHWHPRRGAA